MLTQSTVRTHEDEEELDEAAAVASASGDNLYRGAESVDLGDTVLCVSEAFCCLVPQVGEDLQSVAAPPAAAAWREDGADVNDDARSGSSAGNFTEWLPCAVLLTEQVLRLVRKSPSEAPSVGSSTTATTASTKASDDQVLCTVPLARIVDVASSVCIFGSMLDQEERARVLTSQVPSEPLAGITEDQATCPASGVLREERLVEPTAERQRRLRKTHSKFSKILRRVPQSDLHSMLLKVGPYDFKERLPHELLGAGIRRYRDHPNCCSICGGTGAIVGTTPAGVLEDRSRSRDRGTLQRAAGDTDGEPGEGLPVDRSSADADERHPICCDCASAMLGEGTEPSLEHLRNGVAVGTFELPPIPLARLPETRLGLPAKREPTKDPRQGGKSQRPRNFHSTHGGRPLCDYDESNCQPHMTLDGSIPPLPPSACRLPQRTERELRTQRALHEVSLVVESRGTPFPNVIIVWTTFSASLAKSSGHTRRLQQGTPILLSFVSKEDATTAHDALLTHRAKRLDEWESSRVTQALVAATSEAGPQQRLSPRFGAAVDKEPAPRHGGTKQPRQG